MIRSQARSWTLKLPVGTRKGACTRSGEEEERMLVAVSVSPLGGESDSVGKAVADAVRVVRESGLPNETTAMFTTLEGDWDAVLDVIKRAVEVVQAQAPRVSLVLKAD